VAGVHLEQIALIVDDYDEAIAFFVGALGFDLVEDTPALTNDARPKRWVVVRPPGAATAQGFVEEWSDRNSSAGR
jgi:catechol 2,3-dioxygenase-like lactoylglutathione lyase family enzyme